MSPAGGNDDQTAKEIIFEAQSQLDKQQKQEHGGVVRGSDAAKVQVTSIPLCHTPFPFPPPPNPPPPPLHNCATADVVLLYHGLVYWHIGSLHSMAVNFVLTAGC